MAHTTHTPLTNDKQRGVILVGHGSLRLGSGAAMIRLAARLREAGVAQIAQAGFLNYSQPSIQDVVARCVAQGARELAVVPYFLVPGWFVKKSLPKALEQCRRQHPDVLIHQTEPLGDHPALAQLVLQRAIEANYRSSFPQLAEQQTQPLVDTSDWRPMHVTHPTGLLMIAHGSPDPENNHLIYAVAERVRSSGRYAAVSVCFMDLNQPNISEAVGDFAQSGIGHAIAVPYFLQLGSHVAEDLPQLIGEARELAPGMTLILAEHLGYDRLLLEPIIERLHQSEPQRT